MNKPTTYADWVRCLEAFKEGMQDDVVLACMEKGSIEWTSGVAERLVNVLTQAVEARLQTASELMNVEFSRAAGQQGAVVKALVNARRRYATVYRLVRLPAFPEEVRSTMSKMVERYVRQTQASLEDSAKVDRTGFLASLIRNNALTQYDKVEQEPVQPHVVTPAQPGAPSQPNSPKRRVLLDERSQ